MVVSALDLGAEPECLGRASKRKAVVYDAILVEDNETAAWDNADSRREANLCKAATSRSSDSALFDLSVQT